MTLAVALSTTTAASERSLETDDPDEASGAIDELLLRANTFFLTSNWWSTTAVPPQAVAGQIISFGKQINDHDLDYLSSREVDMGRHWQVAFLAFLVGLLCFRVSAQVSVTPKMAPTPPGNFVVVNNGAGTHYDPHVSGDLVVYSNIANGQYTIHYFNLASNVDSTVPNDGTTMDFLSDVSGSSIVFTRLDGTHSAIFQFDTSSAGSAPVEIAAQPLSERQAAQIGGPTIAWQDFGYYGDGSADVVVYDAPSQNLTRVTNDDVLNQTPAISPDGTVIAWSKCQSFRACDIWSAAGGGTAWSVQQLTNGNAGGGLCSHPDSDGQLTAYSCNRSSIDSIYWQPTAGGTEQVLNISGSSITPSISGGVIAFAYEAQGATNHQILLYNVASGLLYNLTADLAARGLYNNNADAQLNDLSVTPDGRVRVAWQELQAAVYAYSFTLPRAYVANDLSSSVSVIDLSTNKVTATIPVGNGPFNVAIPTLGSNAYVTNQGSGTVSVIDMGTNRVVGSPIPVGSNPTGIATAPVPSQYAYIANRGSNNVTVINISTNAVVGSPIAVGSRPQALAVTPNGTQVYVANSGGTTISVISTASNTVIGAITVPPAPTGVAFHGTHAYVSSLSGYVTVIDTKTQAVVGSPIPIGSGAFALAVAPSGQVYVVNPYARNIVVIDTTSNTVSGPPILDGHAPAGVAFTPDGSYAYITNVDNASVSVVATATRTVVGPAIPVGSAPIGVAIGPLTRPIFFVLPL
jgi:YVTN family beta-propeller protein